MYAEERQQLIATRAHHEGRVSVAALAAELDVAGETIRRDLEALDRAGVLRRVHGGAVPTDRLQLVETGVDERQAERAAQKERIARSGLAQLPTGSGSIVLDAGTTTGRLAELLPTGGDLSVVTNSVSSAATVAARSRTSVYLLGGRIRGVTQATVGAEALRVLARTRVDVAFLGTNGITGAYGCSTPDPDEAAVKQSMVAAARRVVVLADSSKLGQEHLVAFATLQEVDVLVTDDGITDDERDALLAAHPALELVVA
jgi:DeoR family transcriptional regulator, fructose operon transcriptional repressor